MSEKKPVVFKRLSIENAPELIRDLESLSIHPGWKVFQEFLQSEVDLQTQKILTSHKDKTDAELRAILDARETAIAIIQWVPDTLRSVKASFNKAQEKQHGEATEQQSGSRRDRRQRGGPALPAEFDWDEGD